MSQSQLGSTPGSHLGAVVLTGGTAVRLDGVDKTGIEAGGVTLLEHALRALSGIDEVVVVGDEVPTSRPVTFRREDPPGGGPAAALHAGLGGFVRTPTWVLALAGDMPLVTPATISRLSSGLARDGAVLVDEHGKRQYLCAIYSVAALRLAMPVDPHNVSLRSVVDRLQLTEVPAMDEETLDVDSWADVRRLREILAPAPSADQD